MNRRLGPALGILLSILPGLAVATPAPPAARVVLPAPGSAGAPTNANVVIWMNVVEGPARARVHLAAQAFFGMVGAGADRPDAGGAWVAS
jgi:hypothetical protein